MESSGTGINSWFRRQRDEIIARLAKETGEEAAVRFEPVVEKIAGYARLAALFGIAGFIVSLLALIGFLIIMFDLI